MKQIKHASQSISNASKQLFSTFSLQHDDGQRNL